MAKKRFALLTDSNTFVYLGAGATLMGCVNDSRNHIRKLLMGPWKANGYDKAYLLTEGLNDADNVRDKLAEILSAAQPGDEIIGCPGNSSHGTHSVDYITGEKMSCTVCHFSTWDKPRSFVSKLDYKRAYDKYLKPGVLVWNWFDSCESGNMGQAFKLIADSSVYKEPRGNRWIEPPYDVAKDLAKRPLNTERAFPTQVCTMAFCTEQGTCADVQGPNPHGLGSDVFDNYLLGNGKSTWNQIANDCNAKLASAGEEQRFVPNGPDIPLASI